MEKSDSAVVVVVVVIHDLPEVAKIDEIKNADEGKGNSDRANNKFCDFF